MKYKNIKEVDIVDTFVANYYRSPKKTEFAAMGGNVDRVVREHGCYRNFLKAYGYDIPVKSKTIQVLNDRGMVIFEGMPKDIAKEFGVSHHYIAVALRENHKLRDEFTLVEKEIKL